jgi:hypothetical protein
MVRNGNEDQTVKTSRVTIAGLAGVILIASVLAGCTGTGTPGASTAKPSGTLAPTASPTASATASDVLFTIAANVRSAEGSTIGILFTAHKPIPYSNAAVKPYETTFLNQCGDGKGGTAPRDSAFMSANGAMMVPIDIQATTPGKTFVSPVGITMGSLYFGSAITGKTVTPTDPTAPCYGGYEWITSGNLKAIADFESGTPGPDLQLWRYGLYGFGVADGSNATIEACKITLTDLAKTDDVAAVTGWDASAPQSGLSCVIGYTGE